jgi:hypothetical protein
VGGGTVDLVAARSDRAIFCAAVDDELPTSFALDNLNDDGQPGLVRAKSRSGGMDRAYDRLVCGQFALESQPADKVHWEALGRIVWLRPDSAP